MRIVMHWGMNWAWGLPIIILTVVIHASGLGFINRRVALRLGGAAYPRELSVTSISVMGAAALFATVLHAIEGFIWACTYRLLGAADDSRDAVLYSLNAMTSYGHESILLAPRWQMMGALEALDGWILFGLTTACLFAVMQKTWPRTSN
jgi:hypothetical protein